MIIFYDKEGDVLDISIGKPKKALSEELGNDIVIRKDEEGNIVGFTILNFEKRAESDKGFKVPIGAEFELSQ